MHSAMPLDCRPPLPLAANTHTHEMLFITLLAPCPQVALRLPRPSECVWHGYSTADGVTSWEFQLRVAKERNATLPRSAWEADVERSFEAVERRLPAFRLDRCSEGPSCAAAGAIPADIWLWAALRADVHGRGASCKKTLHARYAARSSRRAMVWHEAEHALSTDDGQPLDPAAAPGAAYPFTQIGLLRCGGALLAGAWRGPRAMVSTLQAQPLLAKKKNPHSFPLCPPAKQAAPVPGCGCCRRRAEAAPAAPGPGRFDFEAQGSRSRRLADIRSR